MGSLYHHYNVFPSQTLVETARATIPYLDEAGQAAGINYGL